MSPNSIGYYARNLHWFWRFVWFCVLMAMPWTWFLIIIGVWHLDNRIEDIELKIDPPKESILYIPMPKPHVFRDTIQTYNKEKGRWE